jgi:hypothetical protein
MAEYKLTKFGCLKTTGESIPADQRNRHWQEYQSWLAAGNVPDAADPEPVPDTDLQKAATILQNDPVFRALVKVLAVRFGITPAALVAEIKAKV